MLNLSFASEENLFSHQLVNFEENSLQFLSILWDIYFYLDMNTEFKDDSILPNIKSPGNKNYLASGNVSMSPQVAQE